MASSKRSKHEESLFLRMQPVVANVGFVLIDLRLRTENKKRFLRLYVDKLGGINIDELERVSLVCDPLLEAWGETSHDYFEVQSPGLDRPLGSPIEFQLHVNEDVSVSLYQKLDGRKKFDACLLRADDTSFTVVLPNGAELTLSYEDVAQVKRVIKFN